MAKELLKEAIADAKAVREVALQNAKMALEEAFDSKIKNMLSAKLAEEIEEDVELEEVYEEDETSEGMSYEEDDKVDEAADEDSVDEEINLDELMAELEEMSYMEDDDDMKEGEDTELEESDETLNEVDPSTTELIAGAITGLGVTTAMFNAAGGMGKLKQMLAKAGSSPKAKAQALRNFLGMMGAEAGDSIRHGGGDVDESFDIDALISEIEAELEEGKAKKANNDEVKEAKKKEAEEKKQMEEELAEALSTVETLQETISEINLLNSKLLYCNKLFRANSLNESQKVKVVDALDKASTTGEAKLVFETLQESFTFTGVEKKAIKEGLGRASKAAGVAPQKVITESVDETVSRFQKLANIKF